MYAKEIPSLFCHLATWYGDVFAIFVLLVIPAWKLFIVRIAAVPYNEANV